MKSTHHFVRTMHASLFGRQFPLKPELLPDDFFLERLHCQLEEINELIKAQYSCDLEGVIDALIDEVVFIIGTLDLMGVEFDAHYEEVMRCNLNKVAVKSKAESKRGQAVDLVKPEGWEPPNHRKIILRRLRVQLGESND